METYTNHLIHESSPYLLQHAHNPVEWYPWSDDALNLAKKEQKLIIVSIGYAACHWCHVMEHESFEDTTVANMMNRYYVSIKVDREERPDVDQVYMDAAQLMTGRGGWPLNVIALPDGRPIYAGTYFSRDQWLKVLEGVHDFYVKSPEKALEQAMQVAAGVKQMNYLPAKEASEYSVEKLSSAIQDWLNAMDNKNGGRSGRMKFPMGRAYLTLLRHGFDNNNDQAMKLVRLTLDKMASGGIYDHVGGGFARYSVDPYWNVPHFEKMLYDNAQLIELYSEAYKLTKDEFYRKVIEETISFCNRDLRSAEGGYYSSLDADSEGEEGKYYVWTAAEIKALLGEDSDVYQEYYGVTDQGNWEHGKNVLRISSTPENIYTKNKIDKTKFSVIISRSNDRLLKERQFREAPSLDDKILTSWNGLMLSGLKSAYEATGNENYRKSAVALGDFIWSKMWSGEKLYRNRKDGKSVINGFLDDYAFSISGFINLYQITFDQRWLERADKLTKVTLNEFYDETAGVFRFKSMDDKPLFVARSGTEDNVIPSGNSEMATNLFKLGEIFYKNEYIDIANQMLGIVQSAMLEHAAFYYGWINLYNFRLHPTTEIAILGEDADSIRKAISTNYLGSSLISGDSQRSLLPLLEDKYVKDKTIIYVCVDKVCQLPTERLEDALRQLKIAPND